MKCKICKNRMVNIFTSIDYDCGNKIKKAVNVPALQCTQCDEIIIPDIVMARLKGYSIMEKEDIIDFAKHQQRENDDSIIVNMLLNM